MTAQISNQKQTKINYLDHVSEVLDMNVPVRKWIKSDDKWDGDRREWRLHLTRSGAAFYSEDGGAFPTPRNQAYDKAYIYRKALHGKVALTDMAMAAIKKGKGAFVGVVASEMKGIIKDIMLIEHWFVHRDGTGVVATFQDNTLASSATNVPVNDGRFLKQFTRSGMKFDVYNAALTTKRGTVTVVSVDEALNASGYAVVDFDTTVSGTIATDVLVLENSLNRTITGLDKLVDDAATTFQGLSVASFPEYSSYVASNSGTNRALTPTLLRRFLAAHQAKAGTRATKNMKMIGTPAQLINFDEFYEGELRITPDTKSGGTQTSSFVSSLGKVDLEVDKYANFNKLIYADMNDIRRGVQKKLDWRRDMEGGSSAIFKRSDTNAKYEATLIEFCEYYIKDRVTSAKLEDLTEVHDVAY